jgi:integrase
MRFDDLKHDIWTIATEDREKGNAERLKLPPVAMAIIERQRELKVNDYVFPASREGRRNGPGSHFGAFSAFGKGKDALDQLMQQSIPEMKLWTLHDLRRTARSLMSRAKVRTEIAERTLGHAIPGIEAVYNVHDYDEERANALTELSNLIANIIEPPAPNVVPIRGRETIV